MGREKRVLKLIVTVFMVFMLSTSAFAKDKKSNIVFTTDKFTGITKAEIKKHATAYFPSGLANRGWIEFYAIANDGQRALLERGHQGRRIYRYLAVLGWRGCHCLGGRAANQPAFSQGGHTSYNYRRQCDVYRVSCC